MVSGVLIVDYEGVISINFLWFMSLQIFLGLQSLMSAINVWRVARRRMNNLIRGVGFGIRNDLKPF